MDFRSQFVSSILKLQENTPFGEIVVVGIDGPTASGKTMLANHVADELRKLQKEVWCFRLDWTLTERESRRKDLQFLLEKDALLEFEGDLHMDLGKVTSFLEDVSRFNEQLSIQQGGENSNPLSIEGLYSREADGTMVGKESVELRPNLIILLEGHYTLRNHIDYDVDFQVLLLSDPEELLKRKINRVASYRNPDEAIDYFWRIDIPAFANHMKRYWHNASMIIDNSNYDQPKELNAHEALSWLANAVHKLEPNSEKDFSNKIFSPSLAISREFRKAVHSFIDAVPTLDKKVSSIFRLSIDELKLDFNASISEILQELNKNSKKAHTKLFYTDSFSAMYDRKLPVSMGFCIQGETQVQSLYLLVEFRHSEIFLQTAWSGGYKEFLIKRNFGSIDATTEYEFHEQTVPFSSKTEILKAYVPTEFTIMSFLKEVKYEPVFIGREYENLPASAILSKLAHGPGAWAQRFASQAELHGFQDCLDFVGVKNVQVGSYLIAYRSDSCTDRERFHNFQREWRTAPSKKNQLRTAQEAMDLEVLAQRQEMQREIEQNCKHFVYRDGLIFSSFLYGEKKASEEGLVELGKLLSSKNRLLRKQAIQFIQKNFPTLQIPVRKLWNDVSSQHENALISLHQFARLAPTIFNEVYLWLALRKDRSAVLGANVYDISSASLDSLAFLHAAQKVQAPIVLQASLNAIGQREQTENGNENWGYLKPENGVKDFCNAAIKAARNLFLETGELPSLYGIGLDHVASKQDSPPGRAKRFLEQGIDSGVTHAVLDGSGLFDAKTREPEDLKQAYKRMADYSLSLLGDSSRSLFTDIEVCAGELVYIGSNDSAFIPTWQELLCFVDEYQNSFLQTKHKAMISRPALFIANLGTVHHGSETTPPCVEASESWRDNLKSRNFLSPVLHGTTGSHADVLRRATLGCHKINVAGNFLYALLEALPERIFFKVKNKGGDPKYAIAEIRKDILALSSNERLKIKNNIEAHAKGIIENISSPQLSKMDQSYFQYIPYHFEKNQVDVIMDSIRNSLDKVLISEKVKADLLEKNEFCPSMIEVPFEEFEGPIVKSLVSSGAKCFHIDVGDGKLISREFTGVEKIKFLKHFYPDIRIHVHLMCLDPHIPQRHGMSYIQEYALAGADAIAIHPRAVQRPSELISALNFVRSFGKIPGIVIETSDSVDERMKDLLFEADLNWSIVMGVPIGYGGQLFQFHTLNTISSLRAHTHEINKNFTIECDGGLTVSTIRACRNAGANLFAGWSIIKAKEPSGVAEKFSSINSLIKHRESISAEVK